MSQTAELPPDFKDLDPWDGMAYSIVDRISPLFVNEQGGETFARYAASEAIAAYKPQSRADYASIGRIVSLSLLTMTVAAKVAAADMPVSEQVKAVGKLQALNDSIDRTEKTMAARRDAAFADGSIKRPDSLVGRPPSQPNRFPPLPASDPASGAYAARAYARAMARRAARAAAENGVAAEPPVETTGLTQPAAPSDQREPVQGRQEAGQVRPSRDPRNEARPDQANQARPAAAPLTSEDPRYGAGSMPAAAGGKVRHYGVGAALAKDR